MSPRTSLAPRSAALALVALGALALVAWLGSQWFLGDPAAGAERGRAFAPVASAETGRPGSLAEGLAAAPSSAEDQVLIALPGSAVARREDPHGATWGAEYWSVRMLDPQGDPLPSRGMRVSIDGRETLGFTDGDARLHLARRAGARELEVAMRSTGPTATWWVGRLELPAESPFDDGGFEGQGAFDLGSLRLVSEDQGSLLVLLPTGEPWSHGALLLNGRSVLLDADGRVPLPPHNRWGERLELEHPCLALPAAVPDRLGDGGLPLQLNWSRGTLVVLSGWDPATGLWVHARDPAVPEDSPKNIHALNWGTGDLGEVRLEQHELLDYTVWVANELPAHAVDLRVHHPLWRRPLATRRLALGSLVGNVGLPWITQPSRWADRATVQLVDSAGELLEGSLEALEDSLEEPAGEVGEAAPVRQVIYGWDERFAIAAGEPTEVWLPRSGATRVVATSADGRASIHDLRPGDQVLPLAEALEIELPVTADMREGSVGPLSLILSAESGSAAQMGWRSDLQSGAFSDGTVRFRVPASGTYELLIASSHFDGSDDSPWLHDSESLEHVLLQSHDRWQVNVASDGSFNLHKE